MKIDPILTSFNLWCLSHAQLSEYLSYLGERGLIEALPKQIKVSSSVEKQYIQNNRKSLAADFSRN